MESGTSKIIKSLLSGKDKGRIMKAFMKIDKDNTGTIDMKEWMDLIAGEQSKRLKFYRQTQLVNRRLYFGFGE